MSSPFDAAMAAADAVQNVVYGELVEIRPRSEVPRRGQAADVHRQNPDLVITATIDNAGRLDRLIAAGVKPENLIAWTGIEQPDPQLWRALAARGVESAFGTNGPRATSLDTVYWEDRDGAEYNDLVADGLSILVTGLTDKTGRQLAAARQKSGDCGL